MATATPKKAAPSISDDLAAIARRRAATIKRKDAIGAERRTALERVSALKRERSAEQRAAARELRAPDCASIDAQAATARAAVAELDTQLHALTEADQAFTLEVEHLHESRRTEFVAVASDATERDVEASRSAAASLRHFLGEHRKNVQAWTSAWRGVPVVIADGERDPLRPETYGNVVNARIPGGSLADRIELPASARTVVNGKELFHLAVLTEHVAAALERYAGTPAALATNERQGKPGMYLDSRLGQEIAVTAIELYGHDQTGHKPNPTTRALVTPDEFGLAQLVWLLPLDPGYADLEPQTMDDPVPVELPLPIVFA